MIFFVLSGGLKTFRTCLKELCVLVTISTTKWYISPPCYFTLIPSWIVPENNDVENTVLFNLIQ